MRRERGHGEDRIGARVMISLLDVFWPDPYIWLHEEWHRAALARRGIASHNQSRFFYSHSRGDFIYVNRVKDADLAVLKRDHPAEMVRASTAGLEGELELRLALEKDAFFEESTSWDLALLWSLTLGDILYLHDSIGHEKQTAKQELKEGSEAERDFTGLDPTAAVYDLHRPDEPYRARGLHVTGVGLDRYIDYRELTHEEQQFLRRQALLAWINIVDPQLLGFRSFGGAPRWNFAFRHMLTSFGYVIDGHLFLDDGARDRRWVITYHGYQNKHHHFPGLEFEWWRWHWRALSLTPRAMAWLQPRRQRFDSNTGRPGGLAALRLAYPMGEQAEVYVEPAVKTPGWVAGQVWLDSQALLTGGVTLRF